MTKEEVIDLLEDFNSYLDRIPEEDLYHYMMENSSSYRKTIENLDKYLGEVV